MVGIERTVVPLIGAEEFGIASTTLVVSFIVSFGVVKAFANLVSGQLADVWGRKRVLVLGWLFGLPVPFMIIWAPSWEWIIAANALLGINQGLAWSMTVIMKIDLVGPKSRGLAVGLNEFAGYLAVGVTAFLTGYLASQYGLRPAPFYLGIGYAVFGSRPVDPARSRHARPRPLGGCGHAQQAAADQLPRGLRAHLVPRPQPLRRLAGRARQQPQRRHELGHLPAVLRLLRPRRRAHRHPQGDLSRDLGHPADRHRPLERPLGRKGLIVAGMWVQAAGLFLTAATRQFEWWLVGSLLLGLGTAMVYPEPDRGRLRCLASDLAGPLAQRLPVLARSRLRDRRACCRGHCEFVRIVFRNCLGRDAHLSFRNPGGCRNARTCALNAGRCLTKSRSMAVAS